MGSGGGNGLSVQERDIPMYKTTNIIVMYSAKMIILQMIYFPLYC